MNNGDDDDEDDGGDDDSDNDDLSFLCLTVIVHCKDYEDRLDSAAWEAEISGILLGRE